MVIGSEMCERHQFLLLGNASPHTRGQKSSIESQTRSVGREGSRAGGGDSRGNTTGHIFKELSVQLVPCVGLWEYNQWPAYNNKVRLVHDSGSVANVHCTNPMSCLNSQHHVKLIHGDTCPNANGVRQRQADPCILLGQLNLGAPSAEEDHVSKISGG